MGFGPAYKVATVYGIPIRLHISLVLLLPLLVWAYGPVRGLIYGVCLLLSIVLHELGHSVVAIRKGCRVRQILLLPIGGAAQMESIPRRPWDELQMALAGPAVSATLFALLFYGGAHLPLRRSGPFLGTLFNGVQELGLVNLVLAVFNLLPAFPMDGGRVLRALLARRLGRLRATKIAARIGRVIAVLMLVWSVYLWYLGVGFNMLGVVAVFIFWAAGAEYRAVRYQEWQRLQEWGDWSWSEDESVDNTVRISPPAYRQGPPDEAPLHPNFRPRRFPGGWFRWRR